jgi:hypothetical protein
MTADVLRSDVRHLILWLSKQPFILINGLLCLRTTQSRRVGFFNPTLGPVPRQIRVPSASVNDGYKAAPNASPRFPVKQTNAFSLHVICSEINDLGTQCKKSLD